LETEAVEHVAATLGTPVVRDEEGVPRLFVDGLQVYAIEPEDAEEVSRARRLLGFDINLTLIFADYSGGDGAKSIRVVQNIMRAVVSLAAIRDVHAVLLEDYRDDLISLSVEQGSLTLNAAWEGWTLWPEVLAVIPEPHHMQNLLLQ
jgi:hypothetical protein